MTHFNCDWCGKFMDSALREHIELHIQEFSQHIRTVTNPYDQGNEMTEEAANNDLNGIGNTTGTGVATALMNVQ